VSCSSCPSRFVAQDELSQAKDRLFIMSTMRGQRNPKKRLSNDLRTPKKKKDDRTNKLIMLGYLTRDISFWEKIDTPIVVFADILGDSLGHNRKEEVALPMNTETITKWANKWILPTFDWAVPDIRINSMGLQKTIRTLAEPIYSNFRTEYEKQNPGCYLATWEQVAKCWGHSLRWFGAYWYLHPHLTKKEAYLEALHIGGTEIRYETHVQEVLDRLKACTMKKFYKRQLALQLLNITPIEDIRSSRGPFAGKATFNDEAAASTICMLFSRVYLLVNNTKETY
jgi:hypothetical protein